MFIRIIATPPGEAPEEVRRAWVGLELPLATGETGPRSLPLGGVLSGPHTFLGKLFHLLAGRRTYGRGYVIDAPQSLALLAEKAPWAAQWWREHAPHCWQPGFKFVFAAEACAERAGEEVGRPTAPSRPRSEAFFPAPSAVTRGPLPRPSSEGITDRPPPGATGGGPASAPRSALGWRAAVGGGAVAVVGLAHCLFMESKSGPWALAVAGGVEAVLLGCWLTQQSSQESEGAPRPGRAGWSGFRRPGDVWLFLVLGLVFCTVGLLMLVQPLKARKVTPRMITAQRVAPFHFSLGALVLALALGHLFRDQFPGNRARQAPGPSRAVAPQPAPASTEQVLPSGPMVRTGFHNAKLTEVGARMLELRTPLSLSVLWRGPEAPACAHVLFDRNRGHRPRLFIHALPGVPLGQLPEALQKPLPLGMVVAVELTASPGDAAEASGGPACRLRLVLHEANLPTLDLAPHAEEAWARETGRRLARFLGVALEDRIGG